MIDPDVFSFMALWRHYRRCRRHKRRSANALAFELDAEANLLALQRELRARDYPPGRSVCFITEGPKPREVFAADFRDRIVHHLLVTHQERVFEPIFIHDSYACRVGKGTLAASDRLSTFLRQATANGQRPAWGLKLDVASFFPSIHKATLYQIIARQLADPTLLWLTRTVLFHDPTRNYRFRSRDPHAPGPTSSRYPVPRRKSLFGRDNERGLPIGNLTSQFWANVYLNELDQFVKRELRCRHYMRYVDDLVLLAQDPQTLVEWCAAIETFLSTRLGLALRPEFKTPLPVATGIDFVGWRTWWNRRLPRRRTVANLQRYAQEFERGGLRPAGAGVRCLDLSDGEGARALWNGCAPRSLPTADTLRHGAAWRPWAGVWERLPMAHGVVRPRGLDVRYALVRAAHHQPSAVAAQPVRCPAAPRGPGQPPVLPSGPLHRVLRPATSARPAGAWPAAHPTRAGVLRLHGGISAPAMRCVSSPRARTGVQSRLGPSGPPGDGRGLGAPADEDSPAGGGRRRCKAVNAITCAVASYCYGFDVSGADLAALQEFRACATMRTGRTVLVTRKNGGHAVGVL